VGCGWAGGERGGLDPRRQPSHPHPLPIHAQVDPRLLRLFPGRRLHFGQLDDRLELRLALLFIRATALAALAGALLTVARRAGRVRRGGHAGEAGKAGAGGEGGRGAEDGGGGGGRGGVLKELGWVCARWAPGRRVGGGRGGAAGDGAAIGARAAAASRGAVAAITDRAAHSAWRQSGAAVGGRWAGATALAGPGRARPILGPPAPSPSPARGRGRQACRPPSWK
jgi:hypothetical protein